MVLTKNSPKIITTIDILLLFCIQVVYERKKITIFITIGFLSYVLWDKMWANLLDNCVRRVWTNTE